jgi:hypothetical protein
MDKALQVCAHPTDVPAPGPGLDVEKKKIAGQETEPEAGNAFQFPGKVQTGTK